MTESKKKHSQTPAAAGPEAAAQAAQASAPAAEPAEAAPAVTAEQVEALQKALDEAQAEAAEAQARAKEYFEGWQRERADFSNFKRRVDRDNQILGQTITGELIKKYLLVLDDLDRAMKMRPTEGEAAAWSNGIELVYRKFQSILDAEGIKRIPAETEDFNPSRHEAITFEDSPDHTSGQIIGVVQEGYTLGERVLRPSRVRVAR